MIRLVVSDIDGTLLKSGQDRLSDDVRAELERIGAASKTLAFASGRSLKSMTRILGELAESAYLICLDGAFTSYRGRVVYTRPIGASDVMRVIRADEYRDCSLLLCTPEFSYILRGTEDFAAEVCGLHTDEIRYADSLYEICEPICKISVFSQSGTPKPLAFCPPSLRVCYNSKGWCEYVSAIANKGLAVSDLQMRLYLSKLDTACLGDGENDFEMMKKAKYAYSIGDSAKILESVCTRHAQNVLDVLAEL